MSRVDAVLRPHDLTFARFEVLRLLAFTRQGALPLGKIGARLQVHPASVTSAIDRLERQGFVVQVPHPTDGRAILAEITDAGRRVVDQATLDLNDKAFTQLGLPESDLDELVRILREMRQRAGDFDGVGVDPDPSRRSAGARPAGGGGSLAVMTQAAVPRRPPAGLRHDDLRRDVGPGRAHRGHQPGPGLPRHRRPGGRWPTPPSLPSAPGTTSTRPGRASPSCGRPSPATRSGSGASTSTLDREVLVTAGATEAVAAALIALCEVGDEVVALEPTYDSYTACAAMAGARLRPVTLAPPSYAVDVAALAAAIGPQTRLSLLNSPHNPTGAVGEPCRDGVDRPAVRRERPAGGDRRGRAPGLRRRAPAAVHLPGHGRAHGSISSAGRPSASRGGRWGGRPAPSRWWRPCGRPSNS